MSEDRPRHPLDPLTADEVARAWGLVRTHDGLGPRVRVISVALAEPLRAALSGPGADHPVERAAFVVLIDRDARKVYEAVVSLTQGRVVSWTHVPGVQPAIVLDEFFECEAAVRADPGWQAAMRQRGITDFSLAMVDPWSAGNFGIEDEKGRRLSRTLTWVRRSPTDNGYARPVANLVAIVDLDEMKVIAIEDHGVVPLPPEDANYSPDVAGSRPDLRPLEIRQPEGPSFALDGHELSWQKWRMRLGFTPREGLVLHRVSYRDQGRDRPILHRAAVVDMVVPYGDPRHTYFHRNAFDVGEFGIGTLANSLVNGCDCLGEIRYLDAVVNDSRGGAVTLQNAICVHEEDYGILWKHFDWRTGYSEVRRSRRLVVSFIATVGNYEYGFYWYFYQDGTIQLEVKLTGIVSNGAVDAGRDAALGRAGRAPGVRSDPPALLQRPAGRDDRRPAQLGLRGQHGGRSSGPGEPAPQRLPHRGHACCARRPSRSVSSDPLRGPLLEDRQPVRAKPPRPASRLQAGARRERPALRGPPRRR